MITFRKLWTWALCASVATALIVVFAGLLAGGVQARNRLQLDPSVVLLILPPPDKSDCMIEAFEIVDATHSLVHAAIGTIDPVSGMVEAIPLSTAVDPRLLCDGFE